MAGKHLGAGMNDHVSKPIDPDTVTLESVLLRCAGRVLPTIPQLDLDRQAVTLLPTSSLPAGADCEIEVRGLRDTLGSRASARPELLTFTTSERDEGAVQNGPSQAPHTAEGRATGWSPSANGDYEYFDIAPARGATSDLYADFDGERLWLFFDAIEHRDVLYGDCSAVFSGFVPAGAGRFERNGAGPSSACGRVMPGSALLARRA